MHAATLEACKPARIEAPLQDNGRLCTNLDVAIIGGGPAGLATALALLKAQPGLRIKVFEASPEFAPQGAGVMVAPNGLKALEAIEPVLLHRLVEAAVFIPVNYEYNDETGERMPWQTAIRHLDLHDKYGLAPLMVQWSTLRKSLYSYLPEDIVEFGCKVTGCEGPGLGGRSNTPAEQDGEEDEAPYTVKILRSDSAGQGDSGGVREVLATARHVIAADGYFSRIRRTALDGRTPVFEGTVRWLATVTQADMAAGRVPMPEVLRQEDGLICFHGFKQTSVENPPKGPPERALNLYAVEATQDSGMRFVWSLYAPVKALEDLGEAFPMPRVEEDEAQAASMQGTDLEQTSGHQTSRRGARVLERALAVSGYLPPDVRAMLAATPPERVMEFGMYQHPEDNCSEGTWVRGGTLMLGDAAHAGRTNGQGANLAFEDAAVLGAMVRRHGLGPKAFTAWEETRTARVKEIMFTKDYARRIMLATEVSFEPLWCPLQLAAPGGPLPEDVAAEVRDAVASGGVEKGCEVLRTWSRKVIKGNVEAKLAGRREYETIEPPPGTFRSI